MKLKWGGVLNLENPQTFCEKIQWLKIFDATKTKADLSDKYVVRDYIKKTIGEQYLVPLIAEWDSVDKVDFDVLPKECVIKANHGSGMNLVIHNMDEIDKEKTRKMLRTWMKVNFAFQGDNFEMHYQYVKPRIIVEEYIEQLNGNLYDYKIHCFGGKATYLQLIGDRDLVHHTGKQAFYDMEWNRMPFTMGDYPEYEVDPEKPAVWDEMVQIAEKLSAPFSYVRVDLYALQDRILFGELTFTPGNGLYPKWSPKSTDLEWGRLIQLPKK